MTELENIQKMFAGIGLDHQVKTDQTLREESERWRAAVAQKGASIGPEADVVHTVLSIAIYSCAPEEALNPPPTTLVAVASGDLNLFFDEDGRYVGMGAQGVAEGFWARGEDRPIEATDPRAFRLRNLP